MSDNVLTVAGIDREADGPRTQVSQMKALHLPTPCVLVALCIYLVNYVSGEPCTPPHPSIQMSPKTASPSDVADHSARVGLLVEDYLEKVKTMASVVFLYGGDNGAVAEAVKSSLSTMGVKYGEYELKGTNVEQLTSLPHPALDSFCCLYIVLADSRTTSTVLSAVQNNRRCHWLILHTSGDLFLIQKQVGTDIRMTFVDVTSLHRMVNISMSSGSLAGAGTRVAFELYRSRWYEAIGNFPPRPHTSWDPRYPLAYVGEWRGPGSIDITLRGPGPETDFNGKVFTITTTTHRPFQMKNAHTGKYEGISFDMLNTMSRKMNFSYKIVETQSYGTLENGKWNGMMRLLVDKEVDFAVGAFTISQQRDKVVDFMWPFWEEPCTFLVAERVDSLTGAVYRPFHTGTWACLAASIPVVAVIIWVLYKVDPIRKKHKSVLGEFGLCLLNAFGSIWHQDSHWVPPTDASRVVCVNWWMFGVVVTTLYSANLVAFLSIEKVSLAVNTLEELVASNDFGAVLEKRTALEQLFMDSGENSPTYQALWQKIIKTDAYNDEKATIEDLLLRVGGENLAFIEELTVAQVYAEQHCKLGISSARFFKAYLGFAARKGFPYTEIFNRKIMQLKEGGFVSTWRDKYVGRTSHCDRTKTEATSKQITMVTTTTVWNLLGTGMAAAALVLFIEMIVKRTMTNIKVVPCC